MPTIREDQDDAIVTYTVRELLTRIETSQAAGFASLQAAMANKADKTDIVRIETKLEAHDKHLDKLDIRVGGVESWQHDRNLTEGVNQGHSSRRWTFARKVAAAAGTLLLVAATVLGPLLAAHVI